MKCKYKALIAERIERLDYSFVLHFLLIPDILAIQICFLILAISRIVLLKNRYICIVMDFDDFDDFVKYDLLFNDDEPLRRCNIPPSDDGSGCLTTCIIVAVIAILALIWS